jgi:uncharacterized protein YigE (DUF2233 family)
MTPLLLPSPGIPGEGAGRGFAEAISTTGAALKRRATFTALFFLLLLSFAVVWQFCRPRTLAPGVDLSHFSLSGKHFTVVRVDLRQASLQLSWKDPGGNPFLTFDHLEVQLAPDRLIFATNAGIFAPGYVPLGLHAENGHELIPLNLASGSGNFYLKPNGVFFIDQSGAHIVESSLYPGTTPQTRLATQSGPLLVLNNHLNPDFRKDSNNLQVRSAIGVLSPDKLVFVLSREPVTFYQLATFFRDKLSCPDALYLDGAISRFYPGEKPTGSIESNFAGILAIPENPSRLQARHSPEPDSQPADDKD